MKSKMTRLDMMYWRQNLNESWQLQVAELTNALVITMSIVLKHDIIEHTIMSSRLSPMRYDVVHGQTAQIHVLARLQASPKTTSP